MASVEFHLDINVIPLILVMGVIPYPPDKHCVTQLVLYLGKVKETLMVYMKIENMYRSSPVEAIDIYLSKDNCRPP